MYDEKLFSHGNRRGLFGCPLLCRALIFYVNTFNALELTLSCLPSCYLSTSSTDAEPDPTKTKKFSRFHLISSNNSNTTNKEQKRELIRLYGIQINAHRKLDSSASFVRFSCRAPHIQDRNVFIFCRARVVRPHFFHTR